MTRPPQEGAMLSPSGTDFEAIPPTVKRKYFSTLERLRYAQGQISHEPVSATTTPTMNVFRPKSSGTPKQKMAHLRRPSMFHIRNSNRVPSHGLKEEVPDSPPSLPPESVDWYNRLPEKIRRTAFTFEERHAYARNAHLVTDVAEEHQFYRLNGRQGNKSLPSLSSCSDTASNRDDALRTPMDMSDSIFDTFRLLDTDGPIDMGLDEYHNHVAQTANVTKITPTVKRTRPFAPSPSCSRPSMERGRRSTSIDQPTRIVVNDFPPRTSSSPSWMRPRSSSKSSLPSSFISRPTTPRKPTLLERRNLKRASSQSEIPPVPAIDPEATHVSDPTARMKLKIYLSSAAKFDEALEFGFPSRGASTPTRTNLSPSRPSTASRVTHRRSLSTSAASLSVRRSVSSFGAAFTTKRESVAIGTTFYYDDFESDDEQDDTLDVETVRDSLSLHDSGLDPDDTDIDVDHFIGGAVELPAELPTGLSAAFHGRSPPSTPLRPGDAVVSPAAIFPGPAISPIRSPPSTNGLRLSRSVSLKPRLQTRLDGGSVTALPPVPNSARDFTTLGRSELRTPQTPLLKQWIEPDYGFGEREMTLRLTLTRKDLRADESQIYPDGGTGSWASSFSLRDPASEDKDLAAQSKWKFWSKRR